MQGWAGAAAAISPAQPPVTGTFVSTLEPIQEAPPSAGHDSASSALRTCRPVTRAQHPGESPSLRCLPHLPGHLQARRAGIQPLRPRVGGRCQLARLGWETESVGGGLSGRREAPTTGGTKLHPSNRQRRRMPKPGEDVRMSGCAAGDPTSRTIRHVV